MAGVKARRHVVEHHEPRDATVLYRGGQENRSGHGIAITLREQRPCAEVVQTEEVCKREVHILAVLGPYQRWFDVRPAAHKFAKQILTRGLDLTDPLVRQCRFRVGK